MRSRAICCYFLFLALALSGAASASGQNAFVNRLMPEPQEVHTASGEGVSITSGFSIALDAPPSDALRAAALRMVSRLQNQTGVQFATQLQTSRSAPMVIKVANVTETRPTLGVDESYRIDVEGGTARIDAPTLFGAYHAMETLLQLVQADGSGFILPPVHIVDAPRFPWRGLLLDPGRHFLPVATILRTIDGMAAVKMNVLHLHLSENQGFRIESKRFPKLQGEGSEGLFYTQDQMRGIVAYAMARGIRVVPEFDIPGHSTSWLVGYPELASAPGPYHVEHGFGIFDAVMDPTRETTYTFLDRFFGEMAQVFPDEYVHIGGDESNGKQWRANPAIQRYMKVHGLADTKALQAYFNKRVQAILRKHGRKMIGWDEVLHPDLSPDVVVETWHGTEFLINSARQGHRGLLSQPFYLDHTYTAGKIYSADPIPAGADLSPQETKLILGGEACMWGEMVTQETIDSRIWPRAAVVAERLWSPQQVRDTDDMYRRLWVESLRLDAVGIQHLSGPERLLRQLAGQTSTPALNTLAATLEPVDFHERSRRQHTMQDTPMTGMVDAVVPDPPLQHGLAKMVDAYLQNNNADEHAASRQRLAELFRSWITTGPDLQGLAAAHPRLQPVTVRAAQLTQLGQIGLDAIAAHESNSKIDDRWITNALATLQQAEEPNDTLTVFVVLEPLRELVTAKK